MFRLLWVIFRHKFQDLLYILFYSFFLSNYYNRDPFLHYKTRVNVYMVIGRGVVGSCFWCPLLFVFGVGWGVSYHIDIDSGFVIQKGIPIAIVRQKTVRHKNCKTICTIVLEIYAWRWLIRVETCSKVIIYVILKLSKYIILLCRRNIL